MQLSILSSRLAGQWAVWVTGHWPNFTLPLSRTLGMGSAQTLHHGSTCKVLSVHAAVLDLDHGSPCKVLSVHAAVLGLDHGSTCKVLSVHAAVLDLDHGSTCKVLSVHAAVRDLGHVLMSRERQTVSTATSSWTYHYFSLSRVVKVDIIDMFPTWQKPAVLFSATASEASQTLHGYNPGVFVPTEARLGDLGLVSRLQACWKHNLLLLCFRFVLYGCYIH